MSEHRQFYRLYCRHGKMLIVEQFFSDLGDLRRGEVVVARTQRGRELATVLTEPEPVDIEKMPDFPRVVRRATVDDMERQKELQNVREPSAFDFCNEQVEKLGLKMRLLTTEYIFGGEKIIFYYVAPQRVDFRELVKLLARRYRTRIEMRQVGIRDAARLMLDFGHCGLPICCRAFIKRFAPVTVRTARLQKTTLDPTKISGACGRLMCCLLYEDEIYAELAKGMPVRGERVKTPSGEGEVIGRNIILQTVTVLLSEGERETFPLSEIERLEPQPEQPPEESVRFEE